MPKGSSNGKRVSPSGFEAPKHARQYYGVDADGVAHYVAMSPNEVKNYANKHSEENISRVG